MKKQIKSYERNDTILKIFYKKYNALFLTQQKFDIFCVFICCTIAVPATPLSHRPRKKRLEDYCILLDSITDCLCILQLYVSHSHMY